MNTTVIEFLVIVILISGYILFCPLAVKIDTTNNIYFIKLPGIFCLRLIIGDKIFYLKYSIFFFSFKISPAKPSKGKKSDQKRISAISKLKGLWKSNPRHIILLKKLIVTFRIKKLTCNIDTGDYPLNAQLIPVCLAMNSKKVNVVINFNNHNNIYLQSRSQLIMILYTLLKYFMLNR